jgi:hypothetical protein
VTADERKTRSQSFNSQVSDGLSYNPVDRARTGVSPADLLSRALANDLTHNRPTLSERAVFGDANPALNAAQGVNDAAVRGPRRSPAPSALPASVYDYAGLKPSQDVASGPSFDECMRLARELDRDDPVAPRSWSEQIASNLASNDGEDWAQSRRAQERMAEKERRIEWKARAYMSNPGAYERDLRLVEARNGSGGEPQPLNGQGKAALAIAGVGLVVAVAGDHSPFFKGLALVLFFVAGAVFIVSMNARPGR